MVAFFCLAGGRAGLALNAVAAAGLVGSLLVTALREEVRDLGATWAAFFALSMCIGVLIPSPSASPGPLPRAVRRRRREQAPSHPAVQLTLEEKAAPRELPAVGISAEDDKTTVAQLVAVSFWGGMPLNLRYWRRQADGQDRWVESRSEAFRQPSGARVWRAVTTEINDQRSAAQQPTKIASSPPTDDDAVRAAKLVEKLLGNAWAFDPAGRPTYLTPLAQTFVAWTLEDFQSVVDEGHTFFKLTAHPDDYDSVAAAWRRSLQTGDPFFLDRRIRRGGGIHEWNRVGLVPLHDAKGRLTGWYGSVIDLDSYRIAQAELRDRERELSQLVDMIPSYIWRITPDGVPVFFNKRAADFLGTDVANLEGPTYNRLNTTIVSAVHPDDAADVARALDHSLVSGESFLRRYRLRRADGAYRWVDGRIEALRDQNGEIMQWYGASIDIDDQVRAQSELRRTQERLAQASQAASMAELSASIAHEVNQPLAAVVANSHACRRWLLADPPNLERAQTTIDRIIRDANDVAEVVSRIRALFKREVRTLSRSSLSSVIHDAMRWVSDLAMRHGVLVDSHIDKDVPLVTVDQVQVQQVLINLMRNAVEAMSASTRAKKLSVRAVKAGEFVRVEVQDTGPGIRDAEKIFDAFFTTKENGMGMGLAVSRSIVESHGGRLWVEQNADGGAGFIFTLPIETPTASPDYPIEPSPSAAR
jgi:PAS domain S-box-containing protein